MEALFLELVALDSLLLRLEARSYKMGSISLSTQICILAQSCDVVPELFAGELFPVKGSWITELHCRSNIVEGLAGRVQNSGRLSAIAGSFTTLAGEVSPKKFLSVIKLASRKNRKWFEGSDNWNQRYYRKFKHFKGFLKKNALKWVERIENSLENWSVLKLKSNERRLYSQTTGTTLLHVHRHWDFRPVLLCEEHRYSFVDLWIFCHKFDKKA